MGAGIGETFLLAGFEKVVLYDLRMESLENARNRIKNDIECLKDENLYRKRYGFTLVVVDDLNFEEESKKPKSVGVLAEGKEIDEILTNLYLETDLKKAVSEADFIIEAVSENLELKQKIFQRLGENTEGNTVLATNTSSILISEIAEFCMRKEYVIGFHFHTFEPILAPLIEISPHEFTLKTAKEIGVAVATRLPSFGKDKLVVELLNESPGLIMNRLSIVGGILYESLVDSIVEKGYKLEQLAGLGITFEMIDRIGVDTAYNVANYLKGKLSPDLKPSEQMTQMVREGRLGRKVGEGYYEWKSENEPIIEKLPPDNDLIKLVTEYFNPELSLAMMMNECCRLLKERVLTDCNLIDQIVLTTTGIEGPFGKGREKYQEWSQMLDDYAEKVGISYIKPCKMMKSGDFLKFMV
jgi:3-hydroxyacyl-CoA dehydrogenase